MARRKQVSSPVEPEAQEPQAEPIEEVQSKPPTRAALIRELAAEGLDRGSIARTLSTTYREVRMTLQRELTRGRMTQEAFEATKSGSCGDKCRFAKSDECHCICEGTNHGAGVVSEPAAEPDATTEPDLVGEL